jgi:GxxExxY protein
MVLGRLQDIGRLQAKESMGWKSAAATHNDATAGGFGLNHRGTEPQSYTEKCGGYGEIGMPDGANTSSDPLTERIIGCAMTVHSELGPGLLESAYEACLCQELADNGVAFRRQVPLPVTYKGTRLDCAYRVDILVEQCVIIEIKTVDALLPVHTAQLLTYLKLSGLKTGLLLNFHAAFLRDGIKRCSR